MDWIYVSYENSDREHVREMLSFSSEEEAIEYQIIDLKYHGCGSYIIFKEDEEEN